MEKTTQPALKMLLLKSIVIGNSNPRKQFDEDAINEIAASIKKKGVIQPVLVRPIAGTETFELVCGERRYRGSIIAEKVDIPAYILELTDDEALELQITENLQRKDVHPMEEAFAFKHLLEKYSFTEVAARVGKKDYFVKQRMKLNDLTGKWQTVFYRNMVNLSEALRIALLSPAIQEILYKDCRIDKEDIETRREISINDYTLRRYSGSLKESPFELSDKSIDKKAGPCTTCSFNSAVANLFPDAEVNPVCSNISCFRHKCDIQFDRDIKNALLEPGILFVTNSSYDLDKSIAERLKKEGHQVLERYDDFSYPSNISRYVKDEPGSYRAEFEKQIQSGKYLRAFVVSGDHKGKYTWIELIKKVTSKNAKAALESGKATIADVEGEIARIKEREKRNKELDAEKVHKRIVETLKVSGLEKVPQSTTPTDRVLTAFLVCENTGYDLKDKIKKAAGIDLGFGSVKAEKLYEKLEALTDQQMSYLVRFILFDKFTSSLPPGSSAYMVRKLAESLGNIPIESYEMEQLQKAEKRAVKVAERLHELEEKKKELKLKAVKATKRNAKETSKQ